MNRVKVLGWTALAILATVALFPGSSWSFKNQLDVLTGSWGPSPDWSMDLYPLSVPQFDIEGVHGKDAEIARAIKAEYPQREQLMKALTAEYPRDPDVWGHYANILCMGPIQFEKRFDARYEAIRKERVKELLRATEQGSELDPNNLFFIFLRASTLWADDQKPAALSKLREASRATKYDDFSLDDYRSSVRTIEAKYGYRGEFVRLYQAASVLLPHYTIINRFAKEVSNEGSDADKVALINAASKLSDYSTSMIGVFVAGNVVERAVVPFDEKLSNQASARGDQLYKYADDFDKRLKGKGFIRGVSAKAEVGELLQAQKSMSALWEMNDMYGSPYARPEPFGPMALVALLGVPVFGGMCWLMSAKWSTDRMKLALPHIGAAFAYTILAILAFEAQSKNDGIPWLLAAMQLPLGLLYFDRFGAKLLSIVPTGLALLIATVYSESPGWSWSCGIGALAIWAAHLMLPYEQRAKIAKYGGWSLVAIGAAMTYLDVRAGIPSLAFMSLWAFVHASFAPKLAKAVLPLGFIAALGITGYVFTSRMIDFDSSGTLTFFVFWIFVMLSLPFVILDRKVLNSTIAVAFGLFSTTYLILTGWTMHQNVKDKVSLAMFLDEAKVFREMSKE